MANWQSLIWLPLIGTAIGFVTAGFYLPLTLFYVPEEVAVVLAFGLYSGIGGFRLESAFARLCDETLSPKPRRHGGHLHRLEAAGAVSLVLFILLKFIIFRQFFSAEVWKLFMLGSIAAYCSPVFVSRWITRKDEATPDFPNPPIWMTFYAYAVWIGMLVWLVPTDSLPQTSWPALMDHLRGPIVVFAVSTFVLIICAAWIRETYGKMPPHFGLAIGVPAEISVYVSFLVVRYNFL